MFDGLEKVNTLPSYITAYRKGNSIDDFTLNHIMFLEDTQQIPTDISTSLSDDIEKVFHRITTETQIVAMYQHDCPCYGYTEWVAETGHQSIALFATKHVHIILPVQCGAKQESAFACPTSNVVVSFKLNAFFPPLQLSHPLLVDGYIFKFHSYDAQSTARQPILIIQSYCDGDARYTEKLVLRYLIKQVQWSFDRAGDLSLITKLGHKHKKYSVAIINHPPNKPTLSFLHSLDL